MTYFANTVRTRLTVFRVQIGWTQVGYILLQYTETYICSGMGLSTLQVRPHQMKAWRTPVSLEETLVRDETQTTEHAFPEEPKPVLFVSAQSHDF